MTVDSQAAGSRSTIGVFLDRDGVINAEIDLLHRTDQLTLVARAGEAVRLLNRCALKVIVVTNQSVIARGLCTEDDVDRIHERLRDLLAKEGGRLDEIRYCPHHPNADLPRYRKHCPCRKPDPGMLLDAARKYDLDLTRSFLVGDQTVDMETGRRAGCRTILVRTGYGGRDDHYQGATPEFTCDDLLRAATLITSLVDAGRDVDGS